MVDTRHPRSAERHRRACEEGVAFPERAAALLLTRPIRCSLIAPPFTPVWRSTCAHQKSARVAKKARLCLPYLTVYFVFASQTESGALGRFL